MNRSKQREKGGRTNGPNIREKGGRMNRPSIKVCRFCEDKALTIDYKDVRMLQRFVTERGKIIPRRVSGTCARHQRILTRNLKRARQIALLPFTTDNMN